MSYLLQPGTAKSKIFSSWFWRISFKEAKRRKGRKVSVYVVRIFVHFTFDSAISYYLVATRRESYKNPLSAELNTVWQSHYFSRCYRISWPQHIHLYLILFYFRLTYGRSRLLRASICAVPFIFSPERVDSKGLYRRWRLQVIGSCLTCFAFLQAQETAINRKSDKSVIRMVFKSLETFLNRFNFPTLMRCKVKLL